ncbi:hypothetical protein [Beihai hepe-like virus 9]|uniref:hypothetical protein n=1 Tax=Beihai hepe-like virus 9 TaxID=1922386 RepID=UPI0009099E74|nr:hypothetical protein [Beihai hepe-like virus 9]APG77629.1 hypothetical protein [Beihai hepe-like virus 9]
MSMNIDVAQTHNAPAGVENFNIGGAIKPDSTSMVGNKIEQDTPAPSSVITGGTGGEVRYYNRFDLGNVQLQESTVAGRVLQKYELDSSLIPESYSKHWQQWCIESYKLQIVSTAAFGNATGAIIVGSVPDPQNALGDDPTENLQVAMAMTHSRIVQAKNSTELIIHPGTHESTKTWKWVKKGNSPRLEGFGRIFVICKQPSATGTVAQWTLSCTVTLAFRDHTFNTQYSPAVSIQDPDLIDFGIYQKFSKIGESTTGIGFRITQDVPSGVTIRAYNPTPFYAAILYKHNSSSVVKRKTVPLYDFYVARNDQDEPFAITLVSDLNLENFSIDHVDLIGESSFWIVDGFIPTAIGNIVPLKMLKSYLEERYLQE